MPDSGFIYDEDGTSLTVSVMRFPQRLRDWDLVGSYLELRREVFVEKMSWALDHAEGLEFEQYDSMSTVYIVAHRGRRAVGGARLCRTDRSMGTGQVSYSYMIRDAVRGLLPGLPRDLCYEEPPRDPAVWELTRLATVGDASISRMVLQAANDFLHREGAEECLFLGPAAFIRMAKSLGWNPQPLGPVVGNKDGRFLAFECAILPEEEPTIITP